MLKNIFHIHDKCNGHAQNTVDQIFEIAHENGYEKLYFTEHCPLNSKTLYRPSYQDIKKLKQQIEFENKKYPNIKSYFGYEMEYPIIKRHYFDQLVRDPYCDFVIFGDHHYGDMWLESHFSMINTTSIERVNEYYQMAKDAIESGLFSWFAHPDIWLSAWKKWDKAAKDLTKKLIDLCLENNMPMGFNLNFKPEKRTDFTYPSAYFWKEVAKSKVKVLIEVDSHDNRTLQKQWIEDGYKLALNMGLKNNLIDDIKLKLLDKKPKALIFDLDGVITETSEYHYQSWKQIANLHGMDISLKQNDLIKGMPRKETLLEILKFNDKLGKFNDQQINNLCQQKNELYLQLIKNISENDLNEGILILLKQAKKLGLKVALASSSKNAKAIIKNLKVENYFDYVVDPEEIINPKPAPDIYLKAAIGLNASPYQCIGFEDADIGINGLNDAHMFSVGISKTSKYVKTYSDLWYKQTKDINLEQILKEFNYEAKPIK